MPRRTDEYREISIEVTEGAVEEALAMWITKYHGIEVDRKSIEVVKGEDGSIHARITKRAKKIEADAAETTPEATPMPDMREH
jgi:hypothetical protein